MSAASPIWGRGRKESEEREGVSCSACACCCRNAGQEHFSDLRILTVTRQSFYGGEDGKKWQQSIKAGEAVRLPTQVVFHNCTVFYPHTAQGYVFKYVVRHGIVRHTERKEIKYSI